MKKTLLLLALLLAAPSLNAQSVGASQIKKKSNAGLVADAANALAVGVYRGASAPASPVTGQLWLDTTTTPATLKTYNGSAWEITPTGGVIVSNVWNSLPSSPTDGQIVWSKTMKRAVVYDATAGEWYYLDAAGGRAVPDYSLDVAYTTDFLTPAATTGSVASGGSVTIGTHVCATTFFRASGGETMPGASTGTLTTTSSNQTLSLTIPTGGTGTAGRRVYCSRNGTATPLFYAGTVADNTTTTFNVTVGDASLTVAAPDVDFSASLPTGWTANIGPSAVGGCGSTGASLLCAVYTDSYTDSSASVFGVRLTYAVTGSATGWRARYRLTQATQGFTGSLQQPPPSPIFFASADPTNAASAPSYALAQSVQYTNTPAFPMPAGGYLALLSRGTNGAWSQTSAPELGYRIVHATPMWGEWAAYSPTSGTYVYRMSHSSNGTDWSPVSGAISSTYDVKHVGLALERPTSLWAGRQLVMEIDRFTVENY